MRDSAACQLAGMVSERGARAAVRDGVAWRVVHTKSRQEKALAEALEARGIDFYLPLSRRIRYHGRRKFSASLPLFPGYLFLRGDTEDAYAADRTGRVIRLLDVPDQAGLDADLTQIRLALERGAGLSPAGFPESGKRVEVVGGPFRGLRGVVERRAPEDRLILGIKVLGRAAELEIDRSLLQPAD